MADQCPVECTHSARLARFEAYCEIIAHDVSDIKILLRGEHDRGGLLSRVERIEEKGKSRDKTFWTVSGIIGSGSLAALIKWVLH